MSNPFKSFWFWAHFFFWGFWVLLVALLGIILLWVNGALP
jgi:hypothetical protein